MGCLPKIWINRGARAYATLGVMVGGKAARHNPDSYGARAYATLGVMVGGEAARHTLDSCVGHGVRTLIVRGAL